MTIIGNNRFDNCSIPLVVSGRYFIMEPENLFSVAFEHNGVLIFEVIKNQPIDNSITEVTKNSA